MALAGLRDRGGGACQDGSCGGFGVERVTIALAPASAAVGAVDLDEVVSVQPQVPNEAGTPTAAPLDAEPGDLTKLLRPVLEGAVAAGRGVDADRAQPSSQLVQGHGDVNVAVRVDTNGDDGADRCDRCCCHCYSSKWRWGSAG